MRSAAFTLVDRAAIDDGAPGPVEHWAELDGCEVRLHGETKIALSHSGIRLLIDWQALQDAVVALERRER